MRLGSYSKYRYLLAEFSFLQLHNSWYLASLRPAKVHKGWASLGFTLCFLCALLGLCPLFLSPGWLSSHIYKATQGPDLSLSLAAEPGLLKEEMVSLMLPFSYLWTCSKNVHPIMPGPRGIISLLINLKSTD